jgi:hypothetical protein
MKKRILGLGMSLLGSVAVVVFEFSVELGFCASSSCITNVGLYQSILAFSLVLFTFSLFTFFSRQEIFFSWWKFSSIAGPLVFLISYLIHLYFSQNSNGFFNMNDGLLLLFHILLYVTYIIGSFIAIYRGYRQSKMGGKGGATGAAVDARRVI